MMVCEPGMSKSQYRQLLAKAIDVASSREMLKSNLLGIPPAKGERHKFRKLALLAQRVLVSAY
jgi:hypothetical protein